jgi:hypothetical protein
MGMVFWAGIVVGLTLTAAGAALQGWSVLGITTAQLILCSGLGIIFGAFGSTATIKYKGVVIAGVAAISIVLLLILNHLVRDDFVIVRIDGDIKGAKIELLGDGDRSYYGAELRNAYEFIVIGREISQDRLTMNIVLPPDLNGGAPRERPFECIAKSEIEPYLGSGRKLQWRFDNRRGQLISDNGQRVIAEVGPCPDGRPATVNTVRLDIPTFIGTALAIEREQEVEQLLNSLESQSTVERREARQVLARSGLEVVRPLLDRLEEKSESYRTRLGVVVALAEMLRTRKQQRKEISQLLSVNDLHLLAKAAGDDDRTVRIYASEFLFDLGDPRAVPIALELMKTTSDDGKYNLIIVIQGAIPDLSPEERSRIFASLQQVRETVGSNTQALIDRTVQP